MDYVALRRTVFDSWHMVLWGVGSADGKALRGGPRRSFVLNIAGRVCQPHTGNGTMDLFEQPAVSYTSLRQETVIQHGHGQKASYYAVAAMACQYVYAMNGFDGMVRSSNSVDETIAADCVSTPERFCISGPE